MAKITKLSIDRTICIGAASCVALCPKAFKLDAENKAVVPLKRGKESSGPLNTADLDAEGVADSELLLAAQSCPTKAIALTDDAGKQIYPEV